MFKDERLYNQKLNSIVMEFKNLITEIMDQNQELVKANKELKTIIQELERDLTKCSITGLPNEKDFLDYLDENYIENSKLTLLLISIDNMADINYKYGSKIGNETIKNLSYILLNNCTEKDTIFKLQGAVFGYCILDTDKNKAINIAENIRKVIFDSEAFIRRITVSIGLVYYDEVKHVIHEDESFSSAIYNIALNRLRIARNNGMNTVCSEFGVNDDNDYEKMVLIADTDSMNLRILKTSLEKEGIKVLTAKDGIETIRIIEEQNISLVISELMIPKLDGFSIREKMLMYSYKSTIPFVLMAYKKDEDTVKRAIDLNIDYYFKKPYMLTELVGVVKNKVKGWR